MLKILRIIKRILAGFNRITLPSKWNNFEYNRKVWDRYAKYWNKRFIHFENPEIEKEEIESAHIGDEWGNRKDVDAIVAEYIYPYINAESVVGEIGSGGGRVASRVIRKVREFYCFDISSEMLKKVQARFINYSHIFYHLLDQPQFSSNFKEKFDFVYAFDVFVHLDLHTIYAYFKGLNMILKGGGKAFIHTSNLRAPDGWRRFETQNHYTVEGHYFISPEIIDILASHASFKVVKSSSPSGSNFYLNRDYLVILEKRL